ncbi:MAG TPA: hypothetical protein VNN18_08225 [Candidatus Xenobia bacterium]|nr:hypothetical protein [Candidatus Xenobia bacterium]
MARRGTILALLMAAFVFSGTPVMPQNPAPQEPPAGLAPTVPAPVVTPQSVLDEVNTFYAGYWKAWDDRDIKSIEAGLDPEFLAYLYAAPQGLMQANKEASMDGVRQFFDSVRGQQTQWRRTLLTVEPRSSTEVIAAVRNEFALLGAGGEIEITVEVVRRGADGRWRLLRKWSEKRLY